MVFVRVTPALSDWSRVRGHDPNGSGCFEADAVVRLSQRRAPAYLKETDSCEGPSSAEAGALDLGAEDASFENPQGGFGGIRPRGQPAVVGLRDDVPCDLAKVYDYDHAVLDARSGIGARQGPERQWWPRITARRGRGLELRDSVDRLRRLGPCSGRAGSTVLRSPKPDY